MTFSLWKLVVSEQDVGRLAGSGDPVSQGLEERSQLGHAIGVPGSDHDTQAPREQSDGNIAHAGGHVTSPAAP